NPLPNLLVQHDLHAAIPVDSAVPEEIRRRIGYGRVSGCLPYRLQDGYDRNRLPVAFPVAILENEILRATFLPDLGGRLWSLFHKPSGRELLYTNPVFQPANLAIRNAWFSGGVEWNIGMIGHTPLTCSPLFAARARLDDGTPVLRLYEWERIRGVAYQIDAWLPDGSPVLLVRVRIVNPHDRECPMYWWSNIAVPEAPGTRIIVPAESAYRLNSQTGLCEIPIPRQLETDISYPTQIDRSVDFFFKVAEGFRPWIASLDKEGRGLVQTSTARLLGRKLFVWGMSPGGRHWQDFLSVPGHPYVEIQAGLAPTQSECLPMPAGAEWSWLEAYGLMEADPATIHGADWTLAWRSVGRRVDALVSVAALEETHARTAAMAARAPEDVVRRGSGWGALELRRRARAAEKPFCDTALVFDEASLGPDQVPWIALLEEGRLPRHPPGCEPGAWMVQDAWRELLERSVQNPAGDHWLAWLHLGVMRLQAGDEAGARGAWARSLERERSGWTLRNLAALEWRAENVAAAADLWLEAHGLLPNLAPLASECAMSLLAAGRPGDCVSLIRGLAPTLGSMGRVRYREARARLHMEQYDEVERLLRNGLVLDDLREGENSLTDLWFNLHERRLAAAEGVAIDEALRQRVRKNYPAPDHLEFRGASTG
ncbi:MAG: DUF5107 domain-containing protein, partial [Kiritimatiellia bacterium]|nr:DUF5107 domain-containing protein [Kiritimatiellia bacterium]